MGGCSARTPDWNPQECAGRGRSATHREQTTAFGGGVGKGVSRPNGIRRGRDKRGRRRRQLAETAADFDDLDELLNERISTENLDERIVDFIRSRPADFYCEGIVALPVYPE